MGKKTKINRIQKDLVLSPKPQQTKEFLGALEEAHKIGHGPLGWAGMTKLMMELGLDKHLGIKGKKRIRKKKLRRMLEQTFISSIMQHADWVSLEEAKNRRESEAVLYGEDGIDVERSSQESD